MKKKILVTFLVLMLLLTSLVPTTFAAEGYLSMIDMDQYSYSFNSSYPAPFAGVSRDRAVRLSVGGTVAYCVEFGKTVVSGLGYDSASSWDGLSGDKQALVNYVLMFGYSGSTRYGGTVDQEYWATQILIWQIIYDTVNTSWEDAICNVFMGSTSVAKTIYYQIKANVYSFQTIPSFASRLNNASTPTHELTYNTATGLYEVTLTDTNGVLSSFNFQSSGYSMSRSGNILHITTANPQELVTVSSPKSITSGSAGIIKYWHASSSSYQTVVTYQTGSESDPVNAYFKLKLAAGNCEITKTTEDGDNLAGISFTATGSNGVTRTATTDAAGKALITVLPVGTYTITENASSHHPQYVTASPQTVTIQAGQTAQVSFYNRIKKGQISLLKFEPSDSDSLIKTPMEGVEFTITRKDTGAVAFTIPIDTGTNTITTDVNGYAITPLLNYGVYIVSEVYVEGHTILDPFEVFIDTDGKVYHGSVPKASLVI